MLRAFLKKNMKLPELFEEKMRRLLGEDFSEYEKHFEDLSVSCDESALDR